MRCKKSMLVVGAVICCVMLAVHFLTSATTAEDAKRDEEETASRVMRTANDYRDDMRAILDPTTAPKDLAEAITRFLTHTNDLDHLSNVWQEDIDRLETLAHQEFRAWRGVIETIRNKGARASQAENHRQNLLAFHEKLRAARIALQQLNLTVARGVDIARCINSRDYDARTKRLTDDVTMVTLTVQDRGRDYLQACDHLLELLQERESTQSASIN